MIAMIVVSETAWVTQHWKWLVSAELRHSKTLTGLKEKMNAQNDSMAAFCCTACREIFFVMHANLNETDQYGICSAVSASREARNVCD